jgi:purine-cytosine permease-like protein
MVTRPAGAEQNATVSGLPLELNGANVISDSERKGHPRQLFWPWFAANVSVLGISYGAFILGFGLSFWQAVIAGIVGIVLSFLLVGFVSLAGKRGSAPTMILSRAAFGVRGNALPAILSYILLVGFEIVLVTIATLATSTIFQRLGWGGGNATKIIAFVVVLVMIIASGMLGFDVIMRVQSVITILTVFLTIGYFALITKHISWSAVSGLKSGSLQAVIGGIVFAITGFGLSWTNTGADYSRYLPRRASSRGVVGWTTFGSSLAPIVLIVFGVLLAGSDAKLSAAIGADPIGALTAILPTWYLLLFGVVAILGIVGGGVLDIYSSGLALLTLGFPGPRWMAAGIDGVLTTLGTIYVVWFASDFIGPFQGFLITLGVPIAAWCGIFLADVALRREPYAEPDLFSSAGRYRPVNWTAIALTAVSTAVGWGLVTNTFASWLSWQGYLLSPIGLGGKTGSWGPANLGVIVALAIGFVGYFALSGRRVGMQESIEDEPVGS